MSRRDVPVPRATYRLQLTRDFTFADAGGLAPYLGRLGISHAYLSPVLKARRGSTHGYDTVDHEQLNPELGTLEDFRAMAAAFRAEGIGIILDIVPNHVGVGGDENAYWLDVLEWGPRSRYAEWFDINWSPPHPRLQNRILVPFLGTSLAEALAKGTLELRYDAEAGAFAIWSDGTHKLPLRSESYGEIISAVPDLAALAPRFETAEPADVAGLKTELAGRTRGGAGAALGIKLQALNGRDGQGALGRLLEDQHWRLARYSVAADEINYRRFFIVSDLAGFRVERDEVFEHVHRLIFQLVEEGLVDGLRIDHVDGLFDPKAYLLKLRERCPRPIYLVVEKILAADEAVRPDWQVEGTTGYEFITEAVQLITDPEGEAPLTSGYRAVTGDTSGMEEIERQSKQAIMDFEMAAELESLAGRLHAIALMDEATRDLTRHSLLIALRETVAAMEVYRTYVDAEPAKDEDRRRLGQALERARQQAPTLDPAVFAFLDQIAAGEVDWPGIAPEVVREAAQRLQQFTGPAMAKGLEDTALYRYNRLLSSNDVGHRPDHFAAPAAQFHAFNAARQAATPHAMLTSSSHDTKRGEDVRARLAVLSGMAEPWLRAVSEWRALLEAAGAPAIHANDFYVLMQLLLGAWPAALAPGIAPSAAALEDFSKRLEGAMMKSLREARLRSTWASPDTDYEAQVFAVIRLALDPAGRFLPAFRRFEARIAGFGAQNGLILAALKLTVPGVPDIYQGAEFWEQSLVDPDNRRKVDFAARSAALEGGESVGEALGHWRDGAVKQAVIARLLALRRAAPDLFAQGSYEPIETGDERIVAFGRRHGEDRLVVALRRFPWRGTGWDEALLPVPGRFGIVLGHGEATETGLRAGFDRLPIFVASTIVEG